MDSLQTLRTSSMATEQDNAPFTTHPDPIANALDLTPNTAPLQVLTKETKDREALASIVAYVVKKGPQCYNDKARFGDKPWCEEKQWVLIGRYSGSRFKLEDGAEVRIINDDEVIATILNPDDIVSL